jgi:hypothetical protein
MYCIIYHCNLLKICLCLYFRNEKQNMSPSPFLNDYEKLFYENTLKVFCLFQKYLKVYQSSDCVTIKSSCTRLYIYFYFVLHTACIDDPFQRQATCFHNAVTLKPASFDNDIHVVFRKTQHMPSPYVDLLTVLRIVETYPFMYQPYGLDVPISPQLVRKRKRIHNRLECDKTTLRNDAITPRNAADAKYVSDDV